MNLQYQVFRETHIFLRDLYIFCLRFFFFVCGSLFATGCDDTYIFFSQTVHRLEISESFEHYAMTIYRQSS